MKRIRHIKSLSVIALLLFAISSCKKNTESGTVSGGEEVLVNIKTTISDANEKDISNMARNGNNNYKFQPVVESFLVEDNDIEIVATLTTASNQESVLPKDEIVNKVANKAILTNRAATSIETNKTYGLLIFDKISGNFIASKYYTRGSEGDVEVLKLGTGMEYTAVAFSLNDQSDLSSILKINGAGNNISDYKLELPDDDSAAYADLLYNKFDFTIPADATSHTLTVALKHQFSQVNVTVDSYNVGYAIQSGDAVIKVHGHKKAQLDLSSGAISRPSQDLTDFTMPAFSGLNSTTITSTANVNSSGSLGGGYLLTLNNFKINNQVITPKNFFQNQVLAAGVKYNITIKINPKSGDDGYGDYNTVKIGNYTWLLHNLNSKYYLEKRRIGNPAKDEVSVDYHGQFYQHAYRNGAASVEASSRQYLYGAGSFDEPWIPDGWNTGSEAIPVKHPYRDYCPLGFRIPTAREFQDLLDNTRPSERYGEQGTQYKFGFLLKSIKNPNVQIFFPSQGYFRGTANAPNQGRGTLAYYITSSIATGGKIRYVDIASKNINTYSDPVNTPERHRGVAMPVKCVKSLY